MNYEKKQNKKKKKKWVSHSKKQKKIANFCKKFLPLSGFINLLGNKTCFVDNKDWQLTRKVNVLLFPLLSIVWLFIYSNRLIVALIRFNTF